MGNGKYHFWEIEKRQNCIGGCKGVAHQKQYDFEEEHLKLADVMVEAW